MTTPARRRPFSVTILAFGVLSIAGWGLVRLFHALERWNFLEGLTGVSPLYIAFSGLVWALAGLPVFWGLWRGYRWAARLTQAMALTYALYYWLDVVLMMEHFSGGVLPENWPFAMGLTALLLGFTVWTLNRPAVKSFLGE